MWISDDEDIREWGMLALVIQLCGKAAPAAWLRSDGDVHMRDGAP